jgi:DNA-binding CsgD family transcriptional regulator
LRRQDLVTIRRTPYFRLVGRLSHADLRRVTRFLAALEPGVESDPIPRPTLVALCDVVGADEAEYFELRRADRFPLAHAQSHDWDEAAGSDEALRAVGHQNPLRWRRWHPADGPMRMSALISRRALRRLEFHDAFLRPNRLTDALKVWLHSDAVSVACIQLWQHSGTFAEREEDILGVLHHHLVRTRSEAMLPAPARSASAGLTRREAEVLTWAMRGESDDAIGRRLGMAGGTAGKHLEHAFAKLGVHSRSEALWHLGRRTH